MNTKSNTVNKAGAATPANTAKCNLAIGLFGLKTAKQDEPNAPASQHDRVQDLSDEAA